MYVTDRHYGQLYIFLPDGDFITKIFAGHGGRFDSPTGVTYDAVHDRILVADTKNHQIQLFKGSTGEPVSVFGTGCKARGKLACPEGVAVRPDGNVIAVADTGNQRVLLFSSEGKFLNKCADTGVTPRSIVFDKNGENLYFTDVNGHHVFKLDKDLKECRPLVKLGVLQGPSGIDVDGNGNILVCDKGHNSVKVFSPVNGQLIGTIRTVGGTVWNSPVDLSVGRAGFISVLESNLRIRTI